ncbi:uncharacterized protein LOC124378409 isoform X2 [Silurus meridionalis]|uniref:uncharacterized protein LOC124378409 isoform X2 n=1 Tax=Silurus meridionalis TaxID=175797 RepID=UPI001EEBC1BC|nr:uncharacterized protein LOC124378409 isoform X2 [Silurus meridionalis]
MNLDMKNTTSISAEENVHWPANRDVPIQSGSPAEDTRFSLYDNTTAKIFTVTITDLRAEDANTYWCGIEQPGIDKFTEIQLVIMAGSDAVTTVTGYRGRSVEIKCLYDPGYEEYTKYLCRGECTDWINVLVKSGSPAENTRFSLYDNTIARIFTVNITDLRTEDKDTYWCGIERTGIDIYTELQLLVKLDDPASSTVSQSTHTTYSTSSPITSPSVDSETPPATIQHQTTAPSKNDVPDFATHLLISTGAVVFTVAVIIAVYCKSKGRGPVTSSKETSDVYENYLNFKHLQAKACKSPDSTTDQSNHQNSTFTDIQSNPVYQNLSFHYKK